MHEMLVISLFQLQNIASLYKFAIIRDLEGCQNRLIFIKDNEHSLPASKH